MKNHIIVRSLVVYLEHDKVLPNESSDLEGTVEAIRRIKGVGGVAIITSLEQAVRATEDTDPR